MTCSQCTPIPPLTNGPVTCLLMGSFEKSFVGIVIGIGSFYADVLWPNKFEGKVNINNIEIVELEVQ